jgi:diguanylate cyclase (GGDEF)-like protein
VMAVRLGSEIAPWVLVNNTMFLASANLLALSAAYSMERHLRYEFLQRRIIQAQDNALKEALRDVEKKRSEAEHAARIDPLTGLYNRRHFFSEAERGAGRVSVVILDVDRFKSVNDRFGHATGDLVLREVANRIRANLREIDVACRYGGEEFAVLLPGTSLSEAAAIGERLRREIEGTVVEADSGALSVTVSVGIAATSDGNERWAIDPLIERADEALYLAKQGGRNRVRLWLPRRMLA